MLPVSDRKLVTFGAAQFFHIVIPHQKRPADPAVSVGRPVIRVASLIPAIICIIIKALAPVIEIGWCRLVPSARTIFYPPVFIAVCSARCFRAGQEGTISIFIGGGHGNQIIFLVHDSRLSIRVHQIFRREQAVHRTLQHGVSLSISIRIIGLIVSGLQIQISFVDMDLSLRPVIVDPPPVILAVSTIAMAVVI